MRKHAKSNIPQIRWPVSYICNVVQFSRELHSVGENIDGEMVVLCTAYILYKYKLLRSWAFLFVCYSSYFSAIRYARKIAAAVPVMLSNYRRHINISIVRIDFLFDYSRRSTPGKSIFMAIWACLIETHKLWKERIIPDQA